MLKKSMADNHNNDTYNNVEVPDSNPETISIRHYEVYNPDSHLIVPRPTEILKTGVIPNVIEIENAPNLNVLYQVVCPNDLNLKPAPKLLKPCKKLKELEKDRKSKAGRRIKFPTKFNEFKEIDQSISQVNNETISSDNATEENSIKTIQGNLNIEKKIEPQFTAVNFELWNYLINISSKLSEKGRKFCQELSNLLRNLLAIKNDLFKNIQCGHNEIVLVDEVLGKVLQLTPGAYYFDCSRIYKEDLQVEEKSYYPDNSNNNNQHIDIDNFNLNQTNGLEQQRIVIDNSQTKQSIAQNTITSQTVEKYSSNDFFSLDPTDLQSNISTPDQLISETNNVSFTNLCSTESLDKFDLSLDSQWAELKSPSNINISSRFSSNLSINFDGLMDFSNYDQTELLVSDFNTIFNEDLENSELEKK